MGQKNSHHGNNHKEIYENNPNKKKEITNKLINLNLQKNSFDFLYVIGKGGFGKVWKVFSKKLKRQFALKEMSKAKIIDKKSEKSIRYERDLLSKIKHPFIVNMQYAFQDHENLYLVMDLLTGGDLRYHVSRHKKFSEEQTKFFVCCILLGLEYLHTNNILHRDIKPENLVLDERGYVRITDFGIAKFYQKENYTETSGTPGYMSPEVMCAQNHTIAVDYFALGVITYEFMMGFRPYTGKSRKEIKEKIMAKQAQVKKNEIPAGWSSESADFINRLLQRKPANRLGLRGAQEVKEHAWIKYFTWKELYDKTLEAPFIPKTGDNFDAKYCNAPDKIGFDTKEKYENYLRNENFKDAFKGFTHFQLENEEVVNETIKEPRQINKNNSMGIMDTRENLKGMKFSNPHMNISNVSLNSSLSIKDSSFSLNPNNIEKLNNSENKVFLSSIENKFLKMKKQAASSSSTSSLIRQYKMSNNSMNSTSTSINYFHKRSGSTANIQN